MTLQQLQPYLLCDLAGIIVSFTSKFDHLCQEVIAADRNSFREMAVDHAGGRVFVAIAGVGLVVMHTKSNSLERGTPVNVDPYFMCFANNELYCSTIDAGSNGIVIVSSDRVVRNICTDHAVIRGVAYYNHQVLIACYHSILAVCPQDGHLVHTIDPPMLAAGLCVDQDDLFAASVRDDCITKYSMTTGQIEYIHVCRPWSIAVDRRRQRIYVVPTFGPTVIILGFDGSIIGQLKTMNQPKCVALIDDDARLLVSTSFKLEIVYTN